MQDKPDLWILYCFCVLLSVMVLPHWDHLQFGTSCVLVHLRRCFVTRLGAAAYTARDRGKHLIRFSVPGELHTINTAELAAIHRALKLHDNMPVTIMSDSQVFLYLIRRALYEPSSLRYKTH